MYPEGLRLCLSCTLNGEPAGKHLLGPNLFILDKCKSYMCKSSSVFRISLRLSMARANWYPCQYSCLHELHW